MIEYKGKKYRKVKGGCANCCFAENRDACDYVSKVSPCYGDDCIEASTEVEDIIQEVIDHQNDNSKHPLTCGNDSNHTKLIPVQVGEKSILICIDCDYKQDIPKYFKK